MRNLLLLSTLALALSCGAAQALPNWAANVKPAPLTSTMTPVFDDEFNSLDRGCYSFNGSAGVHNWYTQQDAASGSSYAHCSGQDSTATGILTMTVSYNVTRSRWETTDLARMDAGRDGVAYTGPFYAEARIKLPSSVPAGLDVWPAFWINGRFGQPGTLLPYTEIDVLEARALSMPTGWITVHQWPASPAESTVPTYVSQSTLPSKSPFDDQWHVYGLRVDTTHACAYFDDKLMGCMPLSALTTTVPLYPELSLQTFSTITAATTASYSMYVDYVRVYQ